MKKYIKFFIKIWNALNIKIAEKAENVTWRLRDILIAAACILAENVL